MASDISSYVHKFRASGDGLQQAVPNKINKRNRQPLSCLQCRQRKLRCDRQHPCETCMKRGDESSCTYTKISPSSNAKESSATRSKAQDRLRNLEQLVMQMVENGSPPKSSAVSKTPSTSASSSTLEEPDGLARDGSLDFDTAKYVGSTHWSAILENIQELKSAMVDESTRSMEGDELEEEQTFDQEVLFGAKQTISLQQILSQYLPPRLTIDRLLATYFNAKYMVIPFIHTYQFQRQYEQFWRDQLSTPPLWVSILFSICCLSTQLSQAAGGDIPGQESQSSPTAIYLTAAAQCLISGGYTRPKPHVVEALSLYAQCKYISSLDPSRDVGIIFAILVRLAYRMAYHRDADNFSRFSVFEGEMRRRVWTMCRQFDMMVSFQLGLPNNIPLDSWDTKSPRNLLDSDFDENTKVLPPSRPEHEPTQILYFIVKSRLMTNFGRICNHALSFKNSNQAEIMDLDSKVRATFATVPQVLRVRPMSQSFADPPYLLMVRLNCEFLYKKSLLVLHRKYMTHGFEYSTAACLDAAISIIEGFADIHKEFRRGGALYHDRWMLGSFTMNDFLLASMVLCLALSQWRKRNPGKSVHQDATSHRQVELLQMCFDICRERSSIGVETKKVADALGAMLGQIEQSEARVQASIPPTQQNAASSNGTGVTGITQPNKDPPQFASAPSSGAMNLTPLTLTETPMHQTGTDLLADASLGPFENFLEATENIDWTFLDQYLVNPNQYNEYGMFHGFGSQVLQQDNQADWNSVPYRFLGQEVRPQLPHETVPFQPPTSSSATAAGTGNLGVGNVRTTNGGLDSGYRTGY